MAIPLASEFLSNAGVTMAGSLAGITEAIAEYRQSADKDKVDALYIIFKEISDWQKDHKPGYFTDRRREGAVWSLRTDVLDELDNEVPGLGTALMNYGTTKRGGVRAKKFKALADGYSLERKTYLAGGKKTAPFSGTRVHGAIKGQYEGPRTEVDAMAHARFTTLTEQEFNELGSTTKVRMYFLNKIQRLQRLATKTDDGWVDIAGALLSSKVTWAGGLGNETDCQIYAMDRYGNLVVGAHDMGGRKAQTNHS